MSGRSRSGCKFHSCPWLRKPAAFLSASGRQGPEHCSSLSFGLGSRYPVLGISHFELEAGVEYTFKLSISKEGMPPESTAQTVGAPRVALLNTHPLFTPGIRKGFFF